MEGIRMTVAGQASAATAAAVDGYFAALRDDHGYVPVAEPVLSTTAGGEIVAALLYTALTATVRQRAGPAAARQFVGAPPLNFAAGAVPLLVTLEADGTPDLLALERLTVTTFLIENAVILRDRTDL